MPQGGDFHLQSGSPAIDAGVSLAGIFTDDFEGNSRPVGRAWDIGAYEFGGTGGGGSQNPIAWWEFEEGTGTTAVDSSEMGGHNGTLVNGPTWTAGRVGNFALTFDGADDVVTLPNTVIADFGTSYTVCMWAQTTNAAAIGTGGFKQTLVNLADDSGNGLRAVIHDRTTPAGTWWVTVVAGGARTAAGTTAQALTNNTWTHLCAVFVPNTLTLYVNGVQQSTVSTDACIPPPSSNVLGARTTRTGNLSGQLDEVKIWNRALTAAEVLAEVGG